MPTWSTAGDWDGAQSETGTHHEQPTGSDYAPADTLEKGPPSTLLDGKTPEAVWFCHEDSGSTINDVSGNGNDLTDSGGITYNATPAPLGFSAVSFDGVDDKATSSTTVTFNQDHTWGCWVKTTSTANFAGFTTTDQTSTADAGFSQFVLTDRNSALGAGEFGTTLQLEDDAGNREELNGSDVVNDGAWHLVGGSWDNSAGSVQLWVDGTEDTSTETTQSQGADIAANPFTKGVQLGVTRDDFAFLDGDIAFAFLDLGTVWSATDWSDFYQAFV